MTLISSPINFHSHFIMENQLMDDYETSLLYEWQTAEEDLEFLDYTYCFEVEKPNKRSLPLNASSKPTESISLTDNSDCDEQTILNISLEKLRRIEDPESCLRRSVLINNTLKCIRSGLRVTTEECTNCFTYSVPCKRMRLNGTTNAGTADCLKDLFEDYQGTIMRQDSNSNNEKEIGNQVDKVPSTETSLSTPEVSLLMRQNAEETKRNCDTRRFAELEFPNVICALET